MIAVLDANVLFPAPLRDLLLNLADVKLFQAKWSEKIHEEWTRNLLIKRPDISPQALLKTVVAMDTAFPDASVDLDSAPELSFHMPDKDDKHVLAAAIISNAEWIVTANIKDFPADILYQWQISAIHPDDFVMGLIAEDEEMVREAVNKMVNKLKNPPKTFEEVMEALKKCAMKKTANHL